MFVIGQFPCNFDEGSVIFGDNCDRKACAADPMGSAPQHLEEEDWGRTKFAWNMEEEN